MKFGENFVMNKLLTLSATIALTISSGAYAQEAPIQMNEIRPAQLLNRVDALKEKVETLYNSEFSPLFNPVKETTNIHKEELARLKAEIEEIKNFSSTLEDGDPLMIEDNEAAYAPLTFQMYPDLKNVRVSCTSEKSETNLQARGYLRFCNAGQPYVKSRLYTNNTITFSQGYEEMPQTINEEAIGNEGVVLSSRTSAFMEDPVAGTVKIILKHQSEILTPSGKIENLNCSGSKTVALKTR